MHFPYLSVRTTSSLLLVDSASSAPRTCTRAISGHKKQPRSDQVVYLRCGLLAPLHQCYQTSGGNRVPPKHARALQAVGSSSLFVVALSPSPVHCNDDNDDKPTKDSRTGLRVGGQNDDAVASADTAASWPLVSHERALLFDARQLCTRATPRVSVLNSSASLPRVESVAPLGWARRSLC
jgi:hypothetical protein